MAKQINQGPPPGPPRRLQQFKGDALVLNWSMAVKTENGKHTGKWVKEGVTQLLQDTFNNTDTTTEHAYCGRPNGMADAQKQCPTIARFIAYFNFGELPDNKSTGRLRAQILSCRDDLDMTDTGVLIRRTVVTNPHVPRSVSEQVLVPDVLRQFIFSQHHDSMLGGGHHGFHKTWLKIRQNFWYPGMYLDIQQRHLACATCHARGTKHNKKTGLLQTITAPEPGHTIGIDAVGPLGAGTSRGNVYLIVITDYLTKWAASYAVQSIDSVTTAEVLLEWITMMGPPVRLISDQGSNFCSDVMDDVYRILGIFKARTTAWHPQCNGQTERVNRTLCDMIAKRVAEGGGDWDQIHRISTYDYNTTPHTVTKMTPFFLLYGREARIPLALALGTTLWRDGVEPRGYALELVERLTTAWRLATENIKTRHEVDATRLDEQYLTQHFKKGDKVWLYWPPRTKPGQVKKFLNRWHGPYLITNKNGLVDYTIEDLTATRRKLTQVVHVGRLKPYMDAEITPDVEAILWGRDDFDWRHEPALQKLELVVTMQSSIPDKPVDMDQVTIDYTQKTPTTERKELPLPLDEDPNHQAEQDEPEDEGSKVYEIEGIIGEKLEQYNTMYLIKYKGFERPYWTVASRVAAPELVHKWNTEKARRLERQDVLHKTAEELFNELIRTLTYLRTAWSKGLPKMTSARRTLLGCLGRDSGVLTCHTLKESLQRQIRQLATENEVMIFLNECVDNPQVVFHQELERLRGNPNSVP